MSEANPYQLSPEKVLAPPGSFLESLKYLGPGFILSASIVGSGELLATTIMGAKAGFALLWFIILSCVIKVTVQLEFGKHAIATGETTMKALNSLPGPKLGNAKWPIWLWLILMLAKTCQVGGIVGAVVLSIEQLVPQLAGSQITISESLAIPSRLMVALVVGASVSMLVYRGYYKVLEKASLIMIGVFTVFTLLSLIALQSTEMAITSSEIATGLTPSWPTQAVFLVALGAFGITGVGGDEIMAYNYWLIEKGYAANTGAKEDTSEWETRAKGWIKVMYWDAILAMLCYTLVTAMFYLLGCAVLHRNGTVPESDQLIATLATMYTETLGAWARIAFLFGAIVVLYSTLFAALAAWTRLYSDAFGQLGVIDFNDPKQRHRIVAILAWLFPITWAFLFVYFEVPGMMVVFGGVITVAILGIVVFAALYFRYRRLDERLKPSRFYDVMLWASSIAIGMVILLGIQKLFTQ